jgi:molybdopterin synthase sulfur carrier subunit
LTGGQAKLTVEGATVGGVLHSVDELYPGLKDKLFDDEGNVKRFINVFLNEEEIRTLQGLSTPVAADDKLSIVPAMAGGQE